MELARQWQTSKNTADLAKAADTARLASHDYLILHHEDNAKYRPLMAEALHLASNMHWKLRHHDRHMSRGSEPYEIGYLLTPCVFPLFPFALC